MLLLGTQIGANQLSYKALDRMNEPSKLLFPESFQLAENKFASV